MVALARRSCTWRSATLSVYWRLAQSEQGHDRTRHPVAGSMLADLDMFSEALLANGGLMSLMSCRDPWRAESKIHGLPANRRAPNSNSKCTPSSSKWFQYINLHPGIYNCCSCVLLPTCYIWGDVHFQGRIPGTWARTLRPAGNSLVQLNRWFNSSDSCKYLGRQSFIKNVFNNIKKIWIWNIKYEIYYIIIYYIIIWCNIFNIYI